MEQSRLQKTTRNILTIALVMQLIYMLCIMIITALPQIFLPIFGHSGNYELPFDSIHFGGALFSTVLFVVLWAILNQQISRDKNVGAGFGVCLGIYAYGTYFIMDIILNVIHTYRLNTLIMDSQYSVNATTGENLSGASIISTCCGWAKVWFFTALVLLLIGYGIYCFHCKNTDERK